MINFNLLRLCYLTHAFLFVQLAVHSLIYNVGNTQPGPKKSTKMYVCEKLIIDSTNGIILVMQALGNSNKHY